MFTIYKTECFIVSDDKSLNSFISAVNNLDSRELLRNTKVLFVDNGRSALNIELAKYVATFIIQHRHYGIDCALLMDKDSELDKRMELLANGTKDFNI